MINEDKLTCGEARALLGGSPPDAADARAAAHLASCPDCRAWAEADAALREKLRGAEVELPEGLHDTIMARVRAEKSASRRRSAGIARRFTVGFAAAFVLFAVLTAVLALPLLRGGTWGTENVPLPTAAYSRPLPDSAAPEEPEHSEENACYDAPEDVPGSALPMFPENAGEGSAAEVPSGMPIGQPDGGEESEGKGLPTEDTGAENGENRPISSADGEGSVSERITRILLILSGLFALASFIAFLISLSAVRRRPERDPEKK